MNVPPLRDLPPGRLDDRKRHLRSELAAPRRRARWIAAVAAAAAIVAAVVGIGAWALDDSPPPRAAPTAPNPAAGGGAAGAVCLAVIEYDGHRYLGSGAAVKPTEGEPLGEATVPACNDTPGIEVEPTKVEVAAIEGLEPEVAITERGRGDLWVREDVVQPTKLPALQRLLNG